MHNHLQMLVIIVNMYEVEISVCMFICRIISHEPLNRFASNFDWRTRENHGNVPSLLLKVQVEWVDFYRVKFRQSWVPKLVH